MTPIESSNSLSTPPPPISFFFIFKLFNPFQTVDFVHSILFTNKYDPWQTGQTYAIMGDLWKRDCWDVQDIYEHFCKEGDIIPLEKNLGR